MTHGDPAQRGRQDAVDPVLEAHPPVGEGDLAEVDDVHRAPGADEEAGDALVLAQVVTRDVHGERRYQQDRVALRGRAVVLPQCRVRLVVDNGGRRRHVLLDAGADIVRPRVAGGVGGGLAQGAAGGHAVSCRRLGSITARSRPSTGSGMSGCDESDTAIPCQPSWKSAVSGVARTVEPRP
jgi:hypothetical protein